jgi:predicted nuclease of predicted toxin-antitoxin system
VKLKLDENIGRQGAELLRQAGHDVASVVEQGLKSSSDLNVIEVCRTEGRCLVTLDLDFSNPLRFNPIDYGGIIVLRLPARPTPTSLLDTVQTLIGGLEQEEIIGKLWIVQRERIRIYQQE